MEQPAGSGGQGASQGSGAASGGGPHKPGVKINIVNVHNEFNI